LKPDGCFKKKKHDESSIIVRNKARLVEKGYNQEEGIDCDETYVLVAIEANAFGVLMMI